MSDWVRPEDSVLEGPTLNWPDTFPPEAKGEFIGPMVVTNNPAVHPSWARVPSGFVKWLRAWAQQARANLCRSVANQY